VSKDEEKPKVDYLEKVSKDVWVPPFLMDATKKVQESFDAMMNRDGALNDKQIEKTIENWVKNQTDLIQSNYAKSIEDRFNDIEPAKARKLLLLEKMSPLAKTAYVAVYAIYIHPKKTADEKQRYIDRILNVLPVNVRNEIPEEFQKVDLHKVPELDVSIPPFLVDATKKVQKSFDNMISGVGDLNDKQIEASVETWVKNQTDLIQSDYAEFKVARAKDIEPAKARKLLLLEKMSPMAKTAYVSVYAIYTHPTLKANEKQRFIDKILNVLPSDVRNEIPV
jgi:hypoxanthine phosphoribosyltransferase